jgi:ATP-dependent helicase Lhr and Lhr-like helicase
MRCGSLAQEGRVLEGGFRPGGLHREWCDAEMLRQIRRKSLAKLRREVEPVEQHTLARFLTHWQGLLAPRRTGTRKSRRAARRDREPAGRAAACIAARVFDSAGAHCRVCAGRARYADCRGRSGVGGVEPIGERDGRIALFLADKLPLLAQQRPQA